MSESANAHGGIASVIVPCFNEVAYTRQCLTALARHTQRPWELIAIDNGSTDGTSQYLAGARDMAPFPIRIISNPTNLGFPAACNQGLNAARGEYLVMLNNDAVVTDSWLDQLIALAESDPTIGLTGPMSNYASPPQLIEDITYSNMESMQQFAAHWRDKPMVYRGETLWFLSADEAPRARGDRRPRRTLRARPV